MSVDLTRLQGGAPVEAGTLLDVQSLGSFKYDTEGHLAYVATGLFVNAQGQALAPGDGSGVAAISSAVECGLDDGSSDSVPEDFSFPQNATAALVVPAGAVALRLSVGDCHFHDNSLSDDPIRVRISPRPAAGSAGA